MLRAFHGALATAFVSLVIGAPASAHHSAAVAYDINKTISVNGVISEVKWENPHTWIFVETKDESGKAVKWGFEGRSVVPCDDV